MSVTPEAGAWQGHGPRRDWPRLAAAPALVTRLIRRCLDKDARRRRPDIGDARVELDEGARDVGPGPRAGARRLAMAPWVITAALGEVYRATNTNLRRPMARPRRALYSTTALRM
jgi:hypothetical protein